MKKYLSLLLLLVFVVPSIALASWWNPRSWFNNWGFIFNKKSEKSEVVLLQEKIKELETKLDSNLEKQPISDSQPEQKEKNVYVEKPVVVKTESKIQEKTESIPTTETNEQKKDVNIVFSYINQNTEVFC